MTPTTYLILAPEKTRELGSYAATISGLNKEIPYNVRVTTTEAPPRYTENQRITWSGAAKRILATRRVKAGVRPITSPKQKAASQPSQS